ncbi:hypothetical protein GCM10023075_30690 [Streptosporangium album]
MHRVSLRFPPVSDRQNPTGTAVFVDQTGKRRQLLKITGVVVGTLVLASVVTVVGGLFTGTPLSVVGWPGDTPARPVPVATTPRPTMSASPTPSTTATVAPVQQGSTPTSRPAPQPTVSSQSRVTPLPARSEKPGLLPGDTSSTTSAPPGKEPTAPDPAPEQPPEPASERTMPPGQTKIPPGHDPDKSTGPKK